MDWERFRNVIWNKFQGLDFCFIWEKGDGCLMRPRELKSFSRSICSGVFWRNGFLKNLQIPMKTFGVGFVCNKSTVAKSFSLSPYYAKAWLQRKFCTLTSTKKASHRTFVMYLLFSVRLYLYLDYKFIKVSKRKWIPI